MFANILNHCIDKVVELLALIRLEAKMKVCCLTLALILIYPLEGRSENIPGDVVRFMRHVVCSSVPPILDYNCVDMESHHHLLDSSADTED